MRKRASRRSLPCMFHGQLMRGRFSTVDVPKIFECFSPVNLHVDLPYANALLASECCSFVTVVCECSANGDVPFKISIFMYLDEATNLSGSLY